MKIQTSSQIYINFSDQKKQMTTKLHKFYTKCDQSQLEKKPMTTRIRNNVSLILIGKVETGHIFE